VADSGGAGADTRAGTGWTIGVEEEFLLVDPVTRRSVPLGAAVRARAGKHPAPGPGAAVHAEMLSSQVEAVTGVCTRLADLAEQLAAGRRRLAAAARGEGARLVSTGTPVLEGPVPPEEGDRFRRITAAYAGVVADYQCCGCHVHVGVADRETAVAVVNHLRPWLPTLLALSADSPYDRGRDSGYASWRMLEQSRFPGAGVPPWSASAAAYDERLDRLVDCGTLIDRTMTFWLARPSGRLPTVEVRAADAVGTVGEAVLQAALTRALVRTALGELTVGREAARVDDQVAAAALWAAARYGLSGPGVDPVRACPLPALELVRRLLERVSPALEEAGDLVTVRRELDRLLRSGTGADRQRYAARSAAAVGGDTAAGDAAGPMAVGPMAVGPMAVGPMAVVDMLVGQTAC
jgi:glutamate---cysteine ligase / carboxylate-amine ligase